MGAPATNKVRRATCGVGASGKTAALVARVGELLAQGVAAADVLVVAPSVDGARALAARLAVALGEGVELPRVRSARSLELAALDRVGGESGAPRVLLDVEEALVAADLHAWGFSAADARAALAAANAAWAQGGAPQTAAEPCVEALIGMLVQRGCVLGGQLAAAALAAAQDPEVATALGGRWVLVDDANALSPAALRFADTLAVEGLCLYGDPSWAPSLFDKAADAQAFMDLADGAPVVLPAPAQRLHARTKYAVKWGKAEGELIGMRNYVQRLFSIIEDQTGTVGMGRHDVRSKDELLENVGSDVYVVVPNKAWAHAFAAKLEDRGVPTTQLLAKQPIAGDPRRARSNAALKSFTVLGLAANDRDASLWRTWCALDEPAMACGAWASLEAYAAEKGLALVDALAGLAGDEGAFEGAASLAAAYAAGSERARKLRARRGFALVKGANDAASPEFAALCDPVGGEETAEELFARVYANAIDRRYDDDMRKVRVGCAESLLGVKAPYVLEIGFNEGLAPVADRASDPAGFACEAAAHLNAMAVATKELAVSYITWSPVETAQKMGAVSRRTRMEGGERVAVLAPSPVLRMLGQEIPSTLSGQQFCSFVLDMRV